jgi:acyl carrier protein
MENQIITSKLKEYLSTFLNLSADINLDPALNLVDQIGLDSIEAFAAIATLHEILEVPIAENFNPKIAYTLKDLSLYLFENYDMATLEKFINYDCAKLIKNVEWVD